MLIKQKIFSEAKVTRQLTQLRQPRFVFVLYFSGLGNCRAASKWLWVITSHNSQGCRVLSEVELPGRTGASVSRPWSGLAVASMQQSLRSQQNGLCWDVSLHNSCDFSYLPILYMYFLEASKNCCSF